MALQLPTPPTEPTTFEYIQVPINCVTDMDIPGCCCCCSCIIPPPLLIINLSYLDTIMYIFIEFTVIEIALTDCLNQGQIWWNLTALHRSVRRRRYYKQRID